MNQKIKYIIYGFCLLAVGIGYFGNVTMLWDFSLFEYGLWTFAIIIPSIINMIDSGFHIGNVTFLGCGIYLFLDENEWIHFEFSFQLLVALAFLIMGGYLIFKGVKKS